MQTPLPIIHHQRLRQPLILHHIIMRRHMHPSGLTPPHPITPHLLPVIPLRPRKTLRREVPPVRLGLRIRALLQLRCRLGDQPILVREAIGRALGEEVVGDFGEALAGVEGKAGGVVGSG